MDIFRKNINLALKDDNLQAALDKNAAHRLIARENAYYGFPIDFDSLKQKANGVRAQVISNLDSYLSKFTAKARENGFVVHQAVDAAEARDIVLDICKQHKPKLISKSKSMMSEEIELNPALEAEGIEVVETDLGEYIVQLRGEHPSHIITPAVHLRKEDVGHTFHQKLGIPLTNDIQILTNTARKRLRQTFLHTDIGVSGVNMGVVETGDLCIVTNEGNGRMVTTLPRVHIALMGIERLVPDLDSLALILTMLPRSATGQKIAVYTQLISGPAQPEETDGAQERHLILIDNGRTALSKTNFAEVLFCIRCGACINACPVFREIGGYAYTSNKGAYTPYPGPIGSVLSPSLFGQGEYGHLAQASTLCGACKEACPMDIDLPTLLLRIRSGGVVGEKKPTSNTTPVGISSPIAWGLRLFTWASIHPGIYESSQKILAFLSKILSPRSPWINLPALTGWGFSKDFPRPAMKTFRERWSKIDQKLNFKDTLGTASQKEQTPTINSSTQGVQGTESLTARFGNELTLLNGTFNSCYIDELNTMVVSLLNSKGINKIQSWDAGFLPKGLIDEIRKKGIEITHTPEEEIRVGISGALAAIAETGTIVVTSGEGRPLTTSLLPEIHIVILDEKDIYKNLPQVLHLQEVEDASSVVFISGPSRTGDIEGTLTIGVHGPGEIHVFCVKKS
jgi:L-lactate dehydrogenase complex protein LldF